MVRLGFRPRQLWIFPCSLSETKIQLHVHQGADFFLDQPRLLDDEIIVQKPYNFWVGVHVDFGVIGSFLPIHVAQD